MTIRERLELLNNPSRRKLILFSCSCVRLIWHLLKDDSKKAIEVAEAFVEDLVSKEDVEKTLISAWCVGFYHNIINWSTGPAASWTLEIIEPNYNTNAIVCATYASLDASDRSLECCNTEFTQEQMIAKQHQLFDDIFGNINENNL